MGEFAEFEARHQQASARHATSPFGEARSLRRDLYVSMDRVAASAHRKH
jgi:hypothetical protein